MPWAMPLLAWLCFAPPLDGPVEGPARPPSEPPPPSIEFEPSDGGIVLVPPPPEGDEVAPTLSPLSSPDPEDHRRQIGKPPPNGGAFLAGGLWLAAVGTFGTVLFTAGARSPTSTPYVIATGVALDLMALSMIGVGASRIHDLRRWGVRNRVQPLLQGGGLITSGALSLSLGALLLGWGASSRYPELAILGGVALASGPFQLGFGWAANAKCKRGHCYRLLPQGITFIPRPGGASFVASFAF